MGAREGVWKDTEVGGASSPSLRAALSRIAQVNVGAAVVNDRSGDEDETVYAVGALAARVAEAAMTCEAIGSPMTHTYLDFDTRDDVMACDESLAAAAAVPSLNNDAEVIASLDACPDANWWVRSLIRNPGAGSLASYGVSDAQALLRLACASAPATLVCTQASTLSWF